MTRYYHQTRVGEGNNQAGQSSLRMDVNLPGAVKCVGNDSRPFTPLDPNPGQLEKASRLRP
jgi:hypothetical protein